MLNTPLFEAQPRSTIEDGNYVGTVKSVARDVITPKKGRNAGQEVDVVRWTWWLDAVGEEVEGLTGIDPTSEKSNLFAYLVSLIGTDRSTWLSQQPTDLVGRKALVQVVNDGEGWPKVASVTPLPKTMQQPQAPAPVVPTPDPVPQMPTPAVDPTMVGSVDPAPGQQALPGQVSPLRSPDDDLPF